MKLIESTHEVEASGFVYRIVSNHANDTHIVKRVPVARQFWTHSVIMTIWNGQSFRPALESDICRVSTFDSCKKIINDQVGADV